MTPEQQATRALRELIVLDATDVARARLLLEEIAAGRRIDAAHAQRLHDAAVAIRAAGWLRAPQVR